MVKITVKLKKKPQAAVVVITAMGEEVRIGEGGRIKQGHDVFLNLTSQPAINRKGLVRVARTATAMLFWEMPTSDPLSQWV